MTNTTISNVVYPVANAGVSTNAFVDIFLARNPTGNDTQYPVQKKWLNTATGNFFVLEGFTSLGGVVQAIWVLLGGSSSVQSLTGNSGGAVFPTANNTNVVGDGTFITISGNPATSTLTATAGGGLTTLYTAQSGTATPSSGNLNVFGGAGVTTSASGNTITITASDFASNYTNVTHAMSPYTVVAADEYISVDCSGGAVTLKFPNAPTANRTWTVKDRTGNAATNNITITTVGGAINIDGATSYIIGINYEAIDLLANATPTYEVF